jgi:hypothetical protein
MKKSGRLTAMSVDSNWVFAGTAPDGHSFTLDGIDVWKHEWIDTRERVQVEDPLYRQKFTFHIYEVHSDEKVVRFAAGEFSNCMWGFYVNQLRQNENHP